MDFICAKLYAKLYSKNKIEYRKLLSSDKLVYPDFDLQSISVIPYQCGTILDEEELFYVSNAKEQDFSIDLMKKSYKTQDFEAIVRPEFLQIDFLFVLRQECRFIFFQNVSRTRHITKKRLFRIGENFTFQDDCDEIIIRDTPDAVYDQESDTLYFHKLESVTGLFKGIDQLYREATQEDTEAFLREDFIVLKDDYSAEKVKTANRKRIALASETLKKLSTDQRKQMAGYIGDYCPGLMTENSQFEIRSEQDLKMLLYGIEQRFYTTPIGDEKRLANSVISLS